VGIASEFTLFIIAERGFRVSAWTITAAGDALQKLMNNIRQMRVDWCPKGARSQSRGLGPKGPAPDPHYP
jgi:hypothetical protein